MLGRKPAEDPLLNRTASPLTLEPAHGFVVATGIECSAPVIAGGVRMDELRKTGHWERYTQDIEMIAGFGIRFLRYGIPFHVVDHDPTSRDWAWTDAALAAVRRAGIEPIVDLLHFGVPDDVAGVGDATLPDRFADYAAAFARRYPWVRYYTVVNEPLVCAVFSAALGMWNERASDDRSFVAAIDALSAATALGMDAIRQRRPDAIFIQSDACESYTASTSRAGELATFLNERRFVTWELAYGRSPSAPIVEWLQHSGMTDARLAWFERAGSDEGCIVGLDYYRGNEWTVLADGRTRPARRRLGFAALGRAYHDRLRLPFMLSETNQSGRSTARWLEQVWSDALDLRDEGLPMRGFCWYGFVDHVDWDSALTRDDGRVNHCGLVTLDRQLHPWGATYRRLALDARLGRYERLGGGSGNAAASVPRPDGEAAA